MVNELYHHGIKGQRWGVRRFQNPDGSLTDAGKRRQVRELNSIYKHLDTKQKQYITLTDHKKPPKRFTDNNEYKQYAMRSFLTYDGRKPVSAMTAWRDGDDQASVSIMTRKDYQRRGYGYKAVSDGMRWLKENGVKSQDFELAKKALYGKAVRMFNSAENVADTMLALGFAGREIFSSVESIAKASLDDVNKRLQKQLDINNSAISIILPK